MLWKQLKTVVGAVIYMSIASSVNGQVSISGTDPEVAGKSVTLITYSEFFTKSRNTPLVTSCSNVGEYSFQINASSPTYISVELNGQISGLYVQPGFSYKLITEESKLTAIESADSTNLIIKAFEIRSGAFYAKNNGKKIYYQKLSEFIQHERLALIKRNGIVKEILIYRLAQLELILALNKNDAASLNTLEQTLFNGKIIQNSIPDYFDIFKAYTYERAKALKTRRSPFNFNNSLRGLLEEMKNLTSDSLQQLGYLSILRKAYRSDWWNSTDSVNKIVDSITTVSNNSKVKLISQHIRAESAALAPGTSVKDFQYTTYLGEKGSLSALKGKYVLIDFWFAACAPCVKNFPKLKELKARHHANLEIISLTPFDSSEKIKQFLEKRPNYDWVFSSIPKNDPLIAYFNVLYFPTYFLIGPDGRMIKTFESGEVEKDIYIIEKEIN